MNFRLKIGSETRSLEASPLDETRRTTVMYGEITHSVAVDAIDDNHLNVRLDGRSLNLFVGAAADGAWVWAEGRARFVEDADKLQRRKSSGLLDQPVAVTPPTPATVMRVMVEVCQMVEKGQPCVVVSAMKMELTLAAPYAGTVTAVNTQAGAKVMPGEILVDIEPLTEAKADE
ncbi:MAG: hypothetical protein LDL33_02960 [Desulfomonile sp.]|nr:hypothetical protein [Desulfomonile sp.]